MANNDGCKWLKLNEFLTNTDYVCNICNTCIISNWFKVKYNKSNQYANTYVDTYVVLLNRWDCLNDFLIDMW